MKYLFIIFCFFIISCEKKEKIQIEKNISLEIPNYLKSTKTLNQDAFLQFQNLENELYLTITRENESNFKDTFKNLGYDKITLDLYTKSIIYNYSTKCQDFKILKETKKDNYTIIDFSFKLNYLSLYYKLVVFEKDKFYYQMLIWTLDDFKEKNQNSIDNIIQSIKIE